MEEGPVRVLYVGTQEDGVLTFTYGGAFLGYMNEGIEGLQVNALAFDPLGAPETVLLYAGTDEGLYVCTPWWSQAVVPSTGGPTRISLEAGPNPWRETIQARVTLPANTTSLLRLIDPQGRVVWEQALQHVGGSGRGAVAIEPESGPGLPAGVYLLRLESDRGVASRRLVHVH